MQGKSYASPLDCLQRARAREGNDTNSRYDSKGILRNTKSGKDNGWFVNFPSHLITDKEIEEAVLCFLMGREPLAYLLDLIQYLTGGKVRALLNMNQAKQIRPSSQGGGGPSET